MFPSLFLRWAFCLLMVSAGLSLAAPTPTPTTTPNAVFNHSVSRLAADPIRPRVYATVPSENTVLVIDATSLTIARIIPIGSAPEGLAISVDGSKLWVANSGSTTAAIGVIDLDTLQTLPSLPAPERPYDIEEGAGGRLYVTVAGQATPGGVMQFDGNTGAYQTSFGQYKVYGNTPLEISPDRNTLFFGGGLSVLGKYNVVTTNASLVQEARLDGGAGWLRISHGGQFIVAPIGSGNGTPPYTTFEVPTGNLAGIIGTFQVGAYPGPATFSNGDTLLYHAASAHTNRLTIFDTGTFASVGTIPVTGFSGYSDIRVDRSGRWLFMANNSVFEGRELNCL